MTVAEALAVLVTPGCYDVCAVAKERDHCGQVPLKRLRHGCEDCRRKFLERVTIWSDEL